jgi:hypothetical protein
MIYDTENQPCAGVQLAVDGTDGPMTDIRGRFVIPELSKGDHSVVAKKEGYETLAVSISFLARTDVLHLEMTSFSQLLALAQASFRDTHWNEGEGFLLRAERLDHTDAVLRYLFAVCAYRTGDCAMAIEYLNAIRAGGREEPAVLLLLADIYEKGLEDPEKAIASLEAYLKLRDDPDAKRRLEEMKGKEVQAR